MILKKCVFCDKGIDGKYGRIFCNRNCREKYYGNISEKVKRRKKYQKEYRDNPENKKRLKEWRKDYLQKPEVKEKNRILAVTKYRKRRKIYWKDYGRREKVRSRINKKDRMRRKIDKNYAIKDRLRRSLNHALTKYSKTGKIMGSKKYGINWDSIIESLKPLPKDLKKFEIDHILPLRSFDLTKTEEIKKAFDPSNLQWLTIEENRKKSGKILHR
jgi:hypothetical protein